MTKRKTSFTNKLLNNRFFLKDGFFSKTAVILVAAWVIVLFKFAFQGCLINIPVYDWVFKWPISFDWADAGAILGAVSSLYFSVHNLGNKKNGNGNGDCNDHKDEHREEDRKEGDVNDHRS